MPASATNGNDRRSQITPAPNPSTSVQAYGKLPSNVKCFPMRHGPEHAPSSPAASLARPVARRSVPALDVSRGASASVRNSEKDYVLRVDEDFALRSRSMRVLRTVCSLKYDRQRFFFAISSMLVGTSL